MDKNRAVARFDEAVRLIPLDLRPEIRRLNFDERSITEEIRLRLGKKPSVLIGGRERTFSQHTVTETHLNTLMEMIGGSVHTVSNAMSRGYITTDNGFRVGICGDAAVYEGKIMGFHRITSANIRISRDYFGIAKDVATEIIDGNRVMSTLIISPPGGGKTTFLRDLIRELSNMGYRVSVADERKEICPGFNVGDTVDFLEGIEKSAAIDMLVRSMSPQVIAVDEITAKNDIEAIKNAAYCGVSMIATAHSGGASELYKRPLYRALMEEEIFQRVVEVSIGDMRTYIVRRVEELT